MSDKDMREVYTETLIELGEADERVCVMEADLMRATGTGSFKDRFPERTFNVGVAEANMVGVASGLSAGGKIPWAATFGCFAARRTYDQFFISANYAQQHEAGRNCSGLAPHPSVDLVNSDSCEGDAKEPG